ncbi:MAG: hypothetical protein HC793_05305 [Aquincola sp.]|nr:hypothetical protein [Aquincola sp.]
MPSPSSRPLLLREPGPELGGELHPLGAQRRIAQQGFAQDVTITERYDPSLPDISGNRDVIDAALQKTLYDLSEYNAIRLELTRDRRGRWHCAGLPARSPITQVAFAWAE